MDRPTPSFNSCCLAPVSKVRFIGDGAQRFLLKWAECMKEFSVDIIPILSGDPSPSGPREDSAWPLRDGRWRRLKPWDR